MGKNINLNIPSLFFLNKHKHIWPPISCNTRPKTLSFRATTTDHQTKQLVQVQVQVQVQPTEELELTTTTTTTNTTNTHAACSCFTNSTEYSPSISTESECTYSSAVETIVRGARSDRLFFDPDSTSSVLERSDGNGDGLPGYKESVAVAMETENPYDEFKKSMEEMVEIHELKDWDRLEELLRWYLKMNAKENHELIVGVFFDLVGRTFGGGGDGGGGGGGGDGGVSGGDNSVGSFSSVASSFSSCVSSPDGNL